MSAPRTLNKSSGIFRRKPIDQIEESPDSGGLQRTLGLRQLTAIGVGGIIGAGIFSLAGAVAHETAGPAVLISFLIAGIASAAAAFSYAEFAGLIPRAGSAYTSRRATRHRSGDHRKTQAHEHGQSVLSGLCQKVAFSATAT
jgi:APA family basic amino acid/polyamine antiporter